MTELTLAKIAEHIGAEVKGDANYTISGVATLQSVSAHRLTFLDNPSYRKYLPDTQLGAVILSPEFADKCETHALISQNPYCAYAKAAALFDHQPSIAKGIHPSAFIADDANVAVDVHIAANVSIGARTIIEAGVQIAAGTVIGEDCYIGANTTIAANVTLYHDVHLGKHCRIHSGVVLGADGFGIAMDKTAGAWVNVPQLGGVRIGSHVDVGANTTIDRGAIENTQIHDDVKLDNQIQIGHNVIIGAHTAIAAHTSIAGSTRIGKNCLIGGRAVIAGHVTITDNVILTATTGVKNPIPEPGVYSSGLLHESNESWRKNVLRFRQLDKMARRISALEKQLAAMES